MKKEQDWWLILEDPYYENQMDEILKESVNHRHFGKVKITHTDEE